MPTNGQDLDALVGALVSVLKAIDPPIGTVENGYPVRWAWEERQGSGLFHFVVDWGGISETGAGAGPQFFEMPILTIFCYLPYSRRDPNSSPLWRDRITTIRNTLRSNPTLKVNGVSTIRDTGPAQVTDNQVLRVPGEKEEVLCHYCKINLPCSRWAVYTTI